MFSSQAQRTRQHRLLMRRQSDRVESLTEHEKQIPSIEHISKINQVAFLFDIAPRMDKPTRSASRLREARTLMFIKMKSANKATSRQKTSAESSGSGFPPRTTSVDPMDISNSAKTYSSMDISSSIPVGSSMDISSISVGSLMDISSISVGFPMDISSSFVCSSMDMCSSMEVSYNNGTLQQAESQPQITDTPRLVEPRQVRTQGACI
ncbi:hypothetical protein Tco_1314761 [Tanacetum coccineum]